MHRRRHAPHALALASAALALASTAPTRAAHALVFPVRPPPRGPEFGAQVGYGGFTDGSSNAFTDHGGAASAGYFDGSFAFTLQAGYRFAPYVSVGAEFAYQFLGARGAGDSFDAWRAGAYVRVYPLGVHRWDPFRVAAPTADFPGADLWLSLGADYARLDMALRTLSISGHLDAISVPLGIGVDFHPVRGLALGPAFTWTVWAPVNTCSAWALGSGCSSDHLGADHQLMIALSGRFTLMPARYERAIRFSPEP